jgi:hypothetical protein
MEWPIDLPRPRDRADPAFSVLVQTILRSVMEEAAADRQAGEPTLA